MTILSKDSQSNSDSDGKKNSDPSDDPPDKTAQNSLSTGAIVGIVIGVVAAIVVVVAILIFRRRQQRAKQAQKEETHTVADSPGFDSGKAELHADAIPHTELMGDTHHIHQLHSDSKEKVDQTRRPSQLYELVGSEVPKVPAEYSVQPSPALSAAEGLEGEDRSITPLTVNSTKRCDERGVSKG